MCHVILGAVNTKMQECNMGTLINAGLDQFQILLWLVRTLNHPVSPTHSTLPDGPIKSESSPPLMSTQRLLCHSLQVPPTLPFIWAGSPQMDLKCIQYRILLMFFFLRTNQRNLCLLYCPTLNVAQKIFPLLLSLNEWDILPQSSNLVGQTTLL